MAAKWCWGADLEIVSFIEKDPYCQKVLNKNFKGVPIHDDITTYDGKTCGTVDLITGGFPCQPFSVAGKQKSKEDDRYLWPEMLRVISEVKPAWVIGENVAGIVKLALDDVLADLDSLGYTCQPFIIPAAGVGARHRRDRIWIVANSKGTGIDRINRNNPRQTKKNRNWLYEFDGLCKNVPDTNNFDVQRKQSESNDSKNWEKPRKRQVGLCGRKREWWAVEPGIRRVANGIPNRIHRLKCLGNAIVPQVVFPIMQGIKALGRADE